MSYMNLTKVAELQKKLFTAMTPAEQTEHVLNSWGNAKELVSLYPHAKDDYVRYLIIQETEDPQLAWKFFKNLTGESQGLLRAKLIQYLPPEAEKDIRSFLMSFLNKHQEVLSSIDKLNPEQSRALYQSAKNLGLLPKSVGDYMQNKINQNPVMGPEDV